VILRAALLLLTGCAGASVDPVASPDLARHHVRDMGVARLERVLLERVESPAADLGLPVDLVAPPDLDAPSDFTLFRVRDDTGVAQAFDFMFLVFGF
jgi:hypothetical protein